MRRERPEEWLEEADYVAHSDSARWLRGVSAATVGSTAVRPPPPEPLGCKTGTLQLLSQLSWEEHRWYLRARLDTSLSRADTERLLRLDTRVAAEQAAFHAQRAALLDAAALRFCHLHVAQEVSCCARRCCAVSL